MVTSSAAAALLLIFSASFALGDAQPDAPVCAAHPGGGSCPTSDAGSTGQRATTANGLALIQKALPSLRRSVAAEAQTSALQLRADGSEGLTSRGRSAQALEAGLVTVVSYNLFWWNVAMNNRWNELHNRIRAEGAFDLLGLQECEDVSSTLMKSGLSDFDSFQGPKPNPCPLAWSREAFEPLGEPGSRVVASDQWGERHMSWVRLRHRATKQAILFVNTHGPLNGCDDTLGLHWLEGVKMEQRVGDVVFMTGDFNCPSGTPALNEVKALLVEEFDGGIDHIFSTAQKVSGESKPGWPSDHPLIRGVFSLPSAAPTSNAAAASAPIVPEEDTTAAAPASCGHFEADVDYHGGDLLVTANVASAIYLGSAEACAAACRDTAGCRSFTFARSARACYLKSELRPGKTQSSCCISGLPACGNAEVGATTAAPSTGGGAGSPDEEDDDDGEGGAGEGGAEGGAEGGEGDVEGDGEGGAEGGDGGEGDVEGDGESCGASTFEDGFDYFGADLPASSGSPTFTEDAQRCSEVCRERPGCHSFVFARASRACYLKREVRPGRSPNSCCVAGLPACANSGAATSKASTTASTTAPAPAPVTVPRTTATTTTTTSPDATSTDFEFHAGVNCWAGHGAQPVAHNRDMIGVLSLEACKAECAKSEECEGVVVFRHQDPGNCWLRKYVQLQKCVTKSDWDLWLRKP